MSKPVYITADSTCDLTPALLERFHVKTIPLHIVLGEENYLDGVDFTQEMIYERYAKDKVLPRTAAVSPQAPVTGNYETPGRNRVPDQFYYGERCCESLLGERGDKD